MGVIPVLLVKAHVRAYDRHTSSGQVVHVGEYDDKRRGREMLGQATSRLANTMRTIYERDRQPASKPEHEPPPAEAKKPETEKPQPRYKKTVYSGKPAEEEKVEADKPPPAVVVGARRIKEHGHNEIASDFAKLPLAEHTHFEKWLKVYDKELSENQDVSTAWKYMRVVRRLAGMPEVPQSDDDIKGEREKQTDAQKKAFRGEIEKVPDGTAFIIPQSEDKNMVGKWEKVDVGGEVYWKKGQKYQPSDAFLPHADLVKRQLAQGGAKAPKLVVKAKAEKEKIKPLDNLGEKEEKLEPQEKTSEGQELPLPEGTKGHKVKVWTEKGTEVQVQYAVVPRASLVTSHDTSLRQNKAFPQELQPRDRDRAGLEDQINNIANKLTPERLGENPNAGDGAPIISKDGVVESGNGRTIALSRLYDQKHENSEKYQSWLLNNAEKFGVSADAIEVIKEPVLVRIRTSEVDRQSFVHEANVPPQAAMSASEKAQADKKKLTPEIMQWFAPGEDGDISVQSNSNFIGRFFRDVVGESERNELLTAKGDLNDDGERRVRNAVLAYVYPDHTLVSNLVESGSSVIRNIGTSLLGVSGRLATLKGAIAKGEAFPLDPGAEIAEAARTVMFLKEQKTNIHDYLNQLTLDGKTVPDESKAFLLLFAENIKKPKAIKEFISTYADVAEAAGDPRQTGMFAQQPPTKLEVIEATRRAIAKRGEQGEEDNETKLFKSEGGSSRGVALPVLAVTADTQNREAGTFRDFRRKEAPVPKRRIKARTTWHGLAINIEQPVNSVRWRKDGDVIIGGTRFAYAYGEFPEVMGMDGDPLDVFLGPDLDAGKVYVITILKWPDLKEEDEQKVMVGFRSRADAENAFLLHYDDPRMIGRVDEEGAAEYAEYLKACGKEDPVALVVGIRKSHVAGHYVCRSSYINPAILDAYAKGELHV